MAHESEVKTTKTTRVCLKHGSNAPSFQIIAVQDDVNVERNYCALCLIDFLDKHVDEVEDEE